MPVFIPESIHPAKVPVSNSAAAARSTSQTNVPVGRPNPRGRPCLDRGPALINVGKGLGLVRAADQEHDLPGRVEHGESQGHPIDRRREDTGRAESHPAVRHPQGRRPGKSEAVCPSSPRPSNTRSNSGHDTAKKRLQRAGVLFGRLLWAGQMRGYGENMIRGDRGILQKRLADHFIVAAIVVRRHETLVAEEQKSS